MTRDELQEIRGRIANISAWPWLYTNDDDAAGKNWIVCFGRSAIDNKDQYAITTDSVHSDMLRDAKRDAEFVANAPADIAALLAEIDDIPIGGLLDQLARVPMDERSSTYRYVVEWALRVKSLREAK